jgi:hypothetical protein
VDFADVSPAKLAAALPRLHTLEASSNAIGVTPDVVAGFFENLLPRLQVCRVRGSWPSAARLHAPQPYPLLQELLWHCPFADDSTQSDDTVKARRFMGAQPVVFTGYDTMIAYWVAAGETHPAGGHAAWTPLARVRELRFTRLLRGGLNAPEVARLLRAAPQLQHLHLHTLVDLPTWSSDPSFEGLTHPCLRSVSFADAPRAASFGVMRCAAELRRLHFPRLRYLTMGETAYPADLNGKSECRVDKPA